MIVEASINPCDFPFGEVHSSTYFNWLKDELTKKGIRFRSRERPPFWTVTNEELVDDLIPPWEIEHFEDGTFTVFQAMSQ
jgi:hypothetical protein